MLIHQCHKNWTTSKGEGGGVYISLVGNLPHLDQNTLRWWCASWFFQWKKCPLAQKSLKNTALDGCETLLNQNIPWALVQRPTLLYKRFQISAYALKLNAEYQSKTPSCKVKRQQVVTNLVAECIRFWLPISREVLVSVLDPSSSILFSCSFGGYFMHIIKHKYIMLKWFCERCFYVMMIALNSRGCNGG